MEFVLHATDPTRGSQAPSRRAAPVVPLRAAAGSDVDVETFRAAQAGDEAALERFIRHYERPVFAFLSRTTGPGPHVEDLAQEVFLRVYRALPRFELREAKISTWVFQIAVRLIQDRRKRRQIPLTQGADDWSDPRLNPEEICAGRRSLSRLEILVESLPSEQRTALVLVEFHDLSHAQVAEIMGCRQTTVKTRLHRAREFLREGLRRLEEEHP